MPKLDSTVSSRWDAAIAGTACDTTTVGAAHAMVRSTARLRGAGGAEVKLLTGFLISGARGVPTLLVNTERYITA